MKKSYNYREILGKTLGDAIDYLNVDVHHINHNHDDNREHNLLILPRKMHHKYHMTMNHAEGFCEEISKHDINYVSIGHIDTIKRLVEIKADMAQLYYQQCSVLLDDNINNRFNFAHMLVELSKKYEYYGNI